MTACIEETTCVKKPPSDPPNSYNYYFNLH